MLLVASVYALHKQFPGQCPGQLHISVYSVSAVRDRPGLLVEGQLPAETSSDSNTIMSMM